jgi:hypothetical protein
VLDWKTEFFNQARQVETLKSRLELCIKKRDGEIAKLKALSAQQSKEIKDLRTELHVR